jgi:SH3 domain-containing protein
MPTKGLGPAATASTAQATVAPTADEDSSPTPSASPLVAVVPVAGGTSASGNGSSGGSGGGMLGLLGLAAVVAVGGGFLLLLVARRRSRRDPTEVGLPVAAAIADLVPPVAPVALAEMTPVDVELAPVDDDAPLKKSRKTTRKLQPAAAMGAAAAAKRTFDAPPKRGIARAKVSYRQVRISSEPDAVRSAELGRLDRGDEVEILESHEGFLQIRTPDDITGWILRHTIVGAPST